MMDKRLIIAFKALKSDILNRMKYLRFENEEELKKLCYNVTGYEDCFVWHIIFNLRKFKGNDIIFNHNNITNIITINSFKETLDMMFKKFEKTSGVEALKLKILFNDFLINEELKRKRAKI